MTRRAARAPRPRVGPWSAVVRFAVAACRQDAGGATRAIAAARRLGAPRRELEEAALMLIPNAGFPAGLEALQTLLRAWPARARAGDRGTRATWRARGERLSARVYGPVHARLKSNLEALHPDVATWVIEEGYGRVLARPGLSPRTRELVAIGVLAAGGWERQLVSHLLGAGRLGAAPTDVRRALAFGLRGAGARERSAARRAWSTAFPTG